MEYDEITGQWDYSTLPENVEIGNNCWIERKESFSRFRSTKNPGCKIGDQVKVYTWTTFNLEPEAYLEIGDQSILVGAVFMCSQSITIGRNVVVSYNVTIADGDFHPIDPELRKQDAIANAPEGNKSQRPGFKSRPVVIEDDVSIGIGAFILKGVRFGREAKIGPGSVVTSDVAPGSYVQGNPAVLVNKES